MTQRSHARAHRARADEHDFPAGLPLRGDLRHQLFHLGEVRLLPAIRKHAGTQLDDDSRKVIQQLSTHALLSNKRRRKCRGGRGGAIVSLLDGS